MNTVEDSIQRVVQEMRFSPESLPEHPVFSASKSTPTSPPEPPTTTEILQERQKVHGDFSDDAYTAQMLKGILHHTPNWREMSPVQLEALELICTKIGRICVGNKDHKDHWHDIAGYATLVSQRL
jgi:hypothetical protein